MFSAAGLHSWNLSFDFDLFSWFAIIIILFVGIVILLFVLAVLFVILDILLVAVSSLTCIIYCICSYLACFLEDPLLSFALVRLVKLDFTVVYCIAVVQVKAVVCVGCTHQHVGAIALFLRDPKLIIITMIAVDLDLSFVSDFIAPNVKYKVIVDYATDDDFPVFVGYLPFLGIVVSPLPELDIVIVVRLAIFKGKDVVGVLGKLDDVFAVCNVV